MDQTLILGYADNAELTRDLHRYERLIAKRLTRLNDA